MSKTLFNNENNIRIDRFLRRHFKFLPQGILEKDIRNGKIKVNGKKLNAANFRLNDGDSVEIFSDFETYNQAPKTSVHAALTQEDRRFIEESIIFEDDEICLFNKPYNLAVQGGTDTKRHLDGMLSLYKKGTSYKLVHRLDKDTSGILLLAKRPDVAHFLSDLFKTKEIQKKYIAVVHGHVRSFEGVIDLPLLKDFRGNKEIIVVSPNGREAITEYTVLFKNKEYSVLLLKPITGRTHQLRVHLSHVGHPIVGDFKYGSTAERGTRMHLHAKSITFPYGPRKYISTFEAPIPEDGLFKVFARHIVDK
ncbi:MAG: RluA family pseudouridine synthase [Proteobacteria bacterium]|nr:RluA family pseudouridine synthase [Pseudomonadota bacterium]